MQSNDFEPVALACHDFGVDPSELLGVTHSVDRVGLLLACRLAAETVRAKTRISEVKFAAEITSLRTVQRFGQFWDGRDVPSLDSIFTEPGESTAAQPFTENGKKYVIDGGIKFEVLE